MKFQVITLALSLFTAAAATSVTTVSESAEVEAEPSYMQIIPIEVIGSKQYGDYKIDNVIDGDYASRTTAKQFCTQSEGPDDAMYVYVNLGDVYEVTEVKLWGRDRYDEIFLQQMKNIEVSVAETVENLDNATSLCVYRDGVPTAGHVRPEIFTCKSTMIGQYVRVRMMNSTDPEQFMCFAEMEVYGLTKEVPEVIPVKAVSGSKQDTTHKVDFTNDGNYAESNMSSSFCTGKTDPKYVQFDLGKIYQVTDVKIWGRHGTSSYMLRQTTNLKISVAGTVNDLEEDSSLCTYRVGPPTVENYRPENFACNRTMRGQYVKVEMIDTVPCQYFCLAEMEVYGYNKMRSGGCPYKSRCLQSCVKKYGKSVIKNGRCEDRRMCLCKKTSGVTIPL